MPVLPPGEEFAIEGGLIGRALGTDAGKLIGESLYGILKPFLDLDPAEVTDAQALQAALVSFTFLILLTLAAIGVAVQLVFRIAKLLMKTVLSSVIFLFGSLPGQEGATTGWFKDLAVNTLVFPAIFLMVYISNSLLVGALTEEAEHLTGWPETLAGFLPTFTPVVLGVVALVILLMSFRVPGIIENAIRGRR